MQVMEVLLQSLIVLLYRVSLCVFVMDESPLVAQPTVCVCVCVGVGVGVCVYVYVYVYVCVCVVHVQCVYVQRVVLSPSLCECVSQSALYFLPVPCSGTCSLK